MQIRSLIDCFFLTAVIASYGGAKADSSSPLQFASKPPVVSFEIFEAGPDGELTIPPRDPKYVTYLDKEGVYAIRAGSTVARHIAAVSGQASGISNNDLDLETAVSRQKELLKQEYDALHWLKHHSVKLQRNAIVWHYTFDHAFNNMIVKAGWPSAFAQADVIKAFLLAYLKNSDRSYLELAVRAGYAYTVPCEQGGLRCEVGGVPWFEELPVPYGYAPMILNGHLYSVAILSRLYEMTHDRRVAGAFQVGVTSAKRMLLRYDTGYWSVYQLRPRERDVKVVLAPGRAPTQVHEVALSSQTRDWSAVGLGAGATATYSGSGFWAKGWGIASAWGRELVGLGAVNIQPGRLVTDHDPVDLPALDVSVTYRSPDCVPPILGTYDYRAKSAAYVSIPLIRNSVDHAECTARYALSTAIDQWSQLDEFYHDWHTRLVIELWRATGDAQFYATAVRWGRYKTAEQRLNPEASNDTIFTPMFAPTDSPKHDAEIVAALHGTGPATLSDDAVANGIRLWIDAKRLPPNEAQELMARAGLAAQRVVWPAEPLGSREGEGPTRPPGEPHG
jgi:hypothetical protein